MWGELSLTTIWVRVVIKKNAAGTKNSPSVGFLSRNSTKSIINNEQNSTTNITTMVSHLPPLRCGFNECPQSDAWAAIRRG